MVTRRHCLLLFHLRLGRDSTCGLCAAVGIGGKWLRFPPIHGWSLPFLQCLVILYIHVIYVHMYVYLYNTRVFIYTNIYHTTGIILTCLYYTCSRQHEFGFHLFVDLRKIVQVHLTTPNRVSSSLMNPDPFFHTYAEYFRDILYNLK